MEWLRRLFGWTRQRERALAEELDAHRALVEDELRRSGFSPDEAAREARRRLGNVTLAAEDAREAWTLRSVDQLRQYLRYGVRGLRREPLFALTAVATLALGTAVTTTVFSVVDAEIWRPLPYPDPHRLVAVYSQASDAHASTDGISLDELAEWRRAPGLANLAATIGGRRHATLQRAQAESVVLTEVTANYFTTLGRSALRGRLFTDIDADGASTAVLTERGWTRLFERDPGVVGRVVTLDGQPRTIVGVVPTDDSLGPDPEIYVPIDERPSVAGSASRVIFSTIGRLTAGASPDVVRVQIQPAVTRAAMTDPARRGHVAVAEDLSHFYAPFESGKLYFFLGASLLVLLLTVTNVAGLVLARVLRRTPEFALRGALGGGTRTLVMQLVVEAGLVVIPGCLLGLWVAAEAVGAIGRVVPSDFLQRGTAIAVDGRVFTWCGIIALVTLAGLAIVPLGLARRAGTAAIGAGARTSALPSAGRSRAVLLTSQLALTVILLASAGMFLRSFVALLHVPLGFDPEAAWSASVTLSGPHYVDLDQRRAYADGLVGRALAIPGVRSAAVATSSPLMSGWLVMASDARRPASPTDLELRVVYRAVGGDYFRAIGTPIVRGRTLTAADTASAPAVAVVNEQFVRTLFPHEDAVGRTIVLTPTHAADAARGSVTIVGVASDIKEISPNEVAFADIYVPFAQHPATSLELIVRGPSSDGSTAGVLRAAAAAVDPTMPVTFVSSLSGRVTSSLKGARFNLTLVVGFAGAAVLIAVIGIYGAMAYAATARQREYGVRMALGATPRELVGRALWQAVRLGVGGGIVGIAGALLFAKWLGDSVYLVAGKHSGLLYNVTTTDPLSLAGALLGIVVLALLAGAIPALRVARVDPVQALRAE